MLMRNDLIHLKDQVSRLTPRQKECLRLVARGFQSRAIARELGISSLRVDKHIAEARRILGTASRGDAAKLLQAWELQLETSNQDISWGAPPLALPGTVRLPSNDAMDPISGKTTVQMRKKSHPDEPYAFAEGIRRFESKLFRIEQSGGREIRKPTALAVSITGIAVLGAVGAVASLLFALDWVGRS